MEFNKLTKEQRISLIRNSFFFFLKDVKRFKKELAETKEEINLSESILKSKTESIIFEVEDDNVEYNIDGEIIPFDNMFIASDIIFELNNNLFNCCGFFVLDLCKIDKTLENHILVSYTWSGLNKDGWSLQSFIIPKKVLTIDGYMLPTDNEYQFRNEEQKEILDILKKKFMQLIKKVIFLISTKQYVTYKKFEKNVLVTKNIIFLHDVKTHIRHFWNKEYFNIPNLGKEEWEKLGYKTAEVAFLNGEIKRDIPYTIINQYKVDGENKKENRTINLIQQKQWKQENLLGKLLHQIFPDDYIKRHDRKKLNGLELDYYIPKLQMAFEYDGEQHFDKQLCEDVFSSNFEELQKRDRKKNIKCRDLGIQLIRIKYDEPLTISHIKRKIKA